MAYEAQLSSVVSIDHTPSADVDAGDVVVIGTALLGVAKVDILADALGALCVEEANYIMACADDEIIAIGVPIYWDDTAKEITATATGNIQFGVSVEAATETATSVLCRKINAGAIAAS